MASMVHHEFTSIPTVDELMAVSSQIDRDIAIQILQLGHQWAGGNEKRMLQCINYLTQQIAVQGRDAWSDIRWSGLMQFIKQLSSQINEGVSHYRGHSGISRYAR